MKTKITALILALVMIISMLPVATGAGSYNRSKAVAYAKEHWKDEKGLCAEFVSDCLKAGGSNAWHTGVKGLLDKLKGQGTLYTVAEGTTKSSNWKLNKSACSFDVNPVMFCFSFAIPVRVPENQAIVMRLSLLALTARAILCVHSITEQ